MRIVMHADAQAVAKIGVHDRDRAIGAPGVRPAVAPIEVWHADALAAAAAAALFIAERPMVGGAGEDGCGAGGFRKWRIARLEAAVFAHL